MAIASYIEEMYDVLIKIAPKLIPSGVEYLIWINEESTYTDICITHKISVFRGIQISFSHLDEAGVNSNFCVMIGDAIEHFSDEYCEVQYPDDIENFITTLLAKVYVQDSEYSEKANDPIIHIKGIGEKES